MITIEDIARVAHEANKFFCHAIGDDSQPHFFAAPDWQQTSAIKDVEFHAANPGATPESSHESWLANKLAEGWQYGPVKNPDLKLHPCVKPYDELPPEQQAKDHLFRAVVHALLPFAEGVLRRIDTAVAEPLLQPFEGQFAYFRPVGDESHYVAKITKVWSDTCVNLEWHKGGEVNVAMSVLVWPVGKEEGRPAGYYCELTTDKFDDVYPPKAVDLTASITHLVPEQTAQLFDVGGQGLPEQKTTTIRASGMVPELGAPFANAQGVDSGGTGSTSETTLEEQSSSDSGSMNTETSAPSESSTGAADAGAAS